MKKQMKLGWKPWVFFSSLFVVMIFISFTKESFGLSYFWWHLILHIGVIFFNFLILIYSLRLPEQSMRIVFFASVLWILIESVYFLSHIFEEYAFLETNFIGFIFELIIVFAIMSGFKEAVK